MADTQWKSITWISAFFITGAILAGFIVVLIGATTVSLNFNSDIEAFWTRFYYLFAVSILVERSVEVYLKISGLDGKTPDSKSSESSHATTAALTASLAVSVLLALVGLRILEVLITIQGPNGASLDIAPDLDGNTIVTTLFFGIDVLISAGLMAGGSVVFHPLIKALTLIFEGMKSGAEGRLLMIEGKQLSQNTDKEKSERATVELSTD